MILKPEVITLLFAVAYCLSHRAAHRKKKSERKSPFRNPVSLIPFVNCLIGIPLPRFLNFEGMAERFLNGTMAKEKSSGFIHMAIKSSTDSYLSFLSVGQLKGTYI